MPSTDIIAFVRKVSTGAGFCINVLWAGQDQVRRTLYLTVSSLNVPFHRADPAPTCLRPGNELAPGYERRQPQEHEREHRLLDVAPVLLRCVSALYGPSLTKLMLSTDEAPDSDRDGIDTVTVYSNKSGVVGIALEYDSKIVKSHGSSSGKKDTFVLEDHEDITHVWYDGSVEGIRGIQFGTTKNATTTDGTAKRTLSLYLALEVSLMIPSCRAQITLVWRRRQA